VRVSARAPDPSWVLVSVLRVVTTGVVAVLTIGFVTTVETTGVVVPVTVVTSGLVASVEFVEDVTVLVVESRELVVVLTVEVDPRVVTARSSNTRTPFAACNKASWRGLRRAATALTIPSSCSTPLPTA
jgi:hypothetical protein